MTADDFCLADCLRLLSPTTILPFVVEALLLSSTIAAAVVVVLPPSSMLLRPQPPPPPPGLATGFELERAALLGFVEVALAAAFLKGASAVSLADCIILL